jgi:hypothetical protein
MTEPPADHEDIEAGRNQRAGLAPADDGPCNRARNFSAMLGVILMASILRGFAARENWPGSSHRPGLFFESSGEQPHTRTGGFRARLPAEDNEMKTEGLYQSAADAMGVALYVYPDGSVTNLRKVGVEPTATIEPHERWRPAGDYGLGEQIRKS